MVKRVNTIHSRAAIVFEQLARAASYAPTAREREQFFEDNDNPYYEVLNRLYGEDYALASLADGADFVVHAEGPAAKGNMPELRAVNWICNGVDKQLRALATAALSLAGKESSLLARKIDFRLTGFAPGSLYAGFSVSDRLDQNGEPTLFADETESVIQSIRDAIAQMSQIPKFVNDEDMSEDLAEYITDPALRDASIITAFQLAPTGRIGIHSIEMSSGRSIPQTLSQRERVVLKEAIKTPRMKRAYSGSFSGIIREIDLDSKRFHLRGISGIGTLRCVVRRYDDNLMRPLLNRRVIVSGTYETDASKKPRLMTVENIVAVPEPTQNEIDTAIDS